MACLAESGLIPAHGVIGGLQCRLLLWMLLPLGLVSIVSFVLHYHSAGTAALQQDQQLQRLVPLLADSVVVMGISDSETVNGVDRDLGLALLLAPAIQEFLRERDGFAGYAVRDISGRHLLGHEWLPTELPSTDEAEFSSVVDGGTTYRLIAQRVLTPGGDLILMLADGSDARQHWLGTLLLRVLLPNLLLLLMAAIVVIWVVTRALQPLIDLTRAVEQRSPRDLSPIDIDRAPVEVRPLVESLNRLFALVNTQSEAQRRFVADAAHQLRTPLAGLQAQVEAWAQAAECMHADDTVSLQASQVQQLRNATRRTSQLANQLLALSRVDAIGIDTQSLQRVDLQDLCATILALFLDAATAKCIDLGLEGTTAQTDGHSWLLRELLINLIDNAIKYTPRGGRVTLRCGHSATNGKEHAWIEVEDNGPGIPADKRHRVLERFYRLPTAQGEGNGLGLAIADEIARAHDAQIKLDNGSGDYGLLIRVAF